MKRYRELVFTRREDRFAPEMKAVTLANVTPCDDRSDNAEGERKTQSKVQDEDKENQTPLGRTCLFPTLLACAIGLGSFAQ
jgi:hypothetical protein